TVWRAIGDTSTDFNFYSKRAILSGVISSTMMFWFSDDSENYADTRAFLDRRIADVMQIEKVKAAVSSVTSKLPDPLALLSRLRYPGR
nr:COQ9 family protein [Micropepsaceae bacterium]